jgi:hypothetical protein
MANGNRIAAVTKLVAESAMGLSKDVPQQTRCNLLLNLTTQEPFLDVVHITAQVDHEIGFAAGYLPPALGNKVLADFGVEHPYFGKTIPDHALAFEMGRKMGEQYAEQTAKVAADQHKLDTEAKLGVALPDPEAAVVDGDQAQQVLDALRRVREAKERSQQSLTATVGDTWVGDHGGLHVFDGSQWVAMADGQDVAQYITSLTNKAAGDW